MHYLRTRFGVAGVACLFVLLVLTLGVDSAAAGTASDRPLLFTFNGADTSAGSLTGANALDIDQASDSIYVVDAGRDVIDKFNLAGVAQNFSSTGSSSLSPGGDLNSLSSIAVDNSPANPGRIHVMSEGGPLKAYAPAGDALWSIGGFADVCGLAVDAAGHPWVGDYSNSLAREYATSGAPPSQTGSVSTAPNPLCRLGLDASGNLYANNYGGPVDKYVGGVKVSTLDAESTNGVAVDQSSASGHVFTLHNGSFNEYGASGNLLGTYGSGTIESGSGIAYDASTDRVYVSDQGSNTVEVFGSEATGTVPDVTIEPTTEVGVSKATFHGTVNPQGVPNNYHFEWKQGTGTSWGSAQSSPPASLSIDSSDHVVAYTATGLAGGREYQVRLVGVNTESNLRAVSSLDTFVTSTAAATPSASIDGISGITTTSAHLAATIDTREDTTEWSVQLSSDPACEGGFQSGPTNTIPSDHAGADAVGEDLTSLLPSEHYCVRISATNSAGTTTSESAQFTTDAAAPNQVFAAFAAPRTDTTARLNAYVDPEGSEATYRFEYSPDGSTWTALPDMLTRPARRQIVVASQLSGLQPATIYQYRFAVENEAGSAQSDEKTFETRSTVEMQLPERGIELVNPPNKGNQNIAPEGSQKSTLVSGDGNRLLWKVYAGAPGGTTGTEVSFLSIRTTNGWETRPLAPPAAQQVGSGGSTYRFNLATPDLRHFLMRVGLTDITRDGHPTFVRLDDRQHQDVLQAFPHTLIGETYENADMTDDGAHVIVPNYETRQLEEMASQPHEVVSIMPDGLPAQCGVDSGNFFGFGRGVASDYFHHPDYHRMATTDASRLYFQALPNGGSCAEESGHWPAIYYRDRSADQTVEIDPGTGTYAPGLVRATSDGRSVIFLTEVSHSSADENTTADIYRWDADDESYACLTCVVAEAGLPLNGGGSELATILVSDDFSHVYFISTKQLAPGHGMPGEASLYSLSKGQLNYVAPVGEFVLGGPATLGARLSQDGNVLLFSTSHGAYSRLTADEQVNECTKFNLGLASGKEPDCQALFRYEDSTSSLECLSCRSGGVTAYDVVEDNSVAALSADGSTVAFVTHEPLLPEDINNSFDIYEWHNGALRLITDGETTYPTGAGVTPRVFGMGDSAADIFFTVVDPGLTGYEQDLLSNLYDARVGGGFPRPAATPHCSEEACQGPLAAPPPEQRVASSSFSGAGNQATTKRGRCAAKRGGAKRRCVHRKHVRHSGSPAKGRDSHKSDRGVK